MTTAPHHGSSTSQTRGEARFSISTVCAPVASSFGNVAATAIKKSLISGYIARLCWCTYTRLRGRQTDISRMPIRLCNRLSEIILKTVQSTARPIQTNCRRRVVTFFSSATHDRDVVVDFATIGRPRTALPPRIARVSGCRRHNTWGSPCCPRQHLVGSPTLLRRPNLDGHGAEPRIRPPQP